MENERDRQSDRQTHLSARVMEYFWISLVREYTA